MPSSLAQFHSNALGFSPAHLSRFAVRSNLLQRLAAFLVSMGLSPSGPKPTASHLRVMSLRICQKRPPTCLHWNPITSVTTLLHPRITPPSRYRNINLFPIDYAFRPRLRGRLTLLRLTSCRKPGTSGEKVFHLLYRYSCQHSHF